ncbi:hypothetical protein [Oleispirillum naphthae]|uniref:hypothetical protein n=1 Tax=Oleispirillum naphthae TaxID=2838853 RepID=UPI0030825F7F
MAWLAAIELSVRFLFGQIADTGQLAHLREKIANLEALKDRPAVVFAGNSAARENVDPWAFAAAGGGDAYNLGMSDGTFYAMDKLLERYRGAQFADVRAVYFLINPPDVKIRHLVEIKDAQFMTLRERLSIGMFSAETLLSEISRLYAYREEIYYQIKLLALRKKITETGFSVADDARGFSPRDPDKGGSAAVMKSEIHRVMSGYALPGYQAAALLRTTARLQAEGLRAVWVLPPLPSAVRGELAGGLAAEERQFETWLTAQAARLKVPVIDARAVAADDCFYDFLHLKAEGARRFGAWLARPAPDARLTCGLNP